MIDGVVIGAVVNDLDIIRNFIERRVVKDRLICAVVAIAYAAACEALYVGRYRFGGTC